MTNLEQLLNNDLEQSLYKDLYRDSYYEFFKEAFKQLHPDQPYNDNWHIKYLCDILQQEVERIIRREPRKKDIIINIPFRSAKSLITTVVFPVWCWLKSPTLKIISTSFSGTLALEHAQLSRSLIYTEWFQKLFGNEIVLTDEENAKGFYKTTQGGFRKSIGISGTVTGSGSDITICLPAGQLISTNKGELDIKEIVDKKRSVKIRTLNHKNGNVEFKKIKRYDKNIGKRLIKIKTRSGKELICTEDHEIWTENRGYIKAKELIITDILLRI